MFCRALVCNISCGAVSGSGALQEIVCWYLYLSIYTRMPSCSASGITRNGRSVCREAGRAGRWHNVRGRLSRAVEGLPALQGPARRPMPDAASSRARPSNINISPPSPSLRRCLLEARAACLPGRPSPLRLARPRTPSRSHPSQRRQHAPPISTSSVSLIEQGSVLRDSISPHSAPRPPFFFLFHSSRSLSSLLSPLFSPPVSRPSSSLLPWKPPFWTAVLALCPPRLSPPSHRPATPTSTRPFVISVDPSL